MGVDDHDNFVTCTYVYTSPSSFFPSHLIRHISQSPSTSRAIPPPLKLPPDKASPSQQIPRYSSGGPACILASGYLLKSASPSNNT